MSKRPKLAGAFSTVPTPCVEVQPSGVVSKAVVCTTPPTNTKYGGIPVGLLKAEGAQGPLVTISQKNRPSYPFGVPTIDGNQVYGFSFLGYEMVSGGDSAPPTGSFAYVEAHSAYVLKSGKLYTDRNKMSSATAVATIEMPMSDLGGTWGDTKVPTTTLASNINALFNITSFEEAQAKAATEIKLTDAGAVLLTTNNKRLETETALISYPLPYLPNFNKYIVLLNPPASCKYGATITDVVEQSNRPLKLTLQHVAKSRIVAVEVWQSTLAEAGVDVDALRSIPVVVYIDASLDAWSGGIKLMVVAVATPPPDEDKHIAFAKSPAVKSFFNDSGHDAQEAKSHERSVDHLIMNEGRSVSIKYARAGVANSVLITKQSAVGLVKSHAARMAREQSNESTKGVLAVTKAAADETIVDGLEAIDKITGCATVQSLMERLNSQMDDAECEEQHAKMVCAATFLHALLMDEKVATDALRPQVYGYKSMEDAADGDESDFEDGDDDESDLDGNL